MSQQPKYSQSHTPSVLKFHGSRTATNSCAYFTPLLKPDYNILDVGCGPGSITSTLATLIPEGSIIGVDSSEDAVTAAAKREDLPKNCTFQTADAMHLPFEDNTFDVAHTSQVLTHLSDPVAAMAEMRRVIKPGGFLASREGDSESTIFFPRHPGVLLWKQVQTGIHKLYDAKGDAGRMLVDWAFKAGFQEGNVQWTAGTFEYATGGQAEIGKTMATRVREDKVWRGSATSTGLVDEDGLENIALGWEAVAADPAGVFSLICGQVVCYK